MSSDIHVMAMRRNRCGVEVNPPPLTLTLASHYVGHLHRIIRDPVSEAEADGFVCVA